MQLKWANEQRSRVIVLYGPVAQAAHEITVRGMETGEQTRVPFDTTADVIQAHT